MFLPVIYPSLFFSFVFTIPFFFLFFFCFFCFFVFFLFNDELPGSNHTDRLTFFVCLFWFIRRVLSSDATVADLALFSEKEERPPKIEEFKNISRYNEAFLRCRIVPFPFSFAGLDSGPTATAAATAESPYAIDAHQFPGPH